MKPMNLRGEEVAASVRDWAKEDIKNGPPSRVELGKFFFTVSTGTLALFATLLKFAVDKPSLSLLTVGCFLFLLGATGLGLYMAIPYVLRIRGETDLWTEYERLIHSTVFLMYLWFVLWLIGFVLGVVKLFCG